MRTAELLKDFSKFSKRISKLAFIGTGIAQDSISSLSSVLKTHIGDIVTKAKTLIAERKAAKRLESVGQKAEEAEKNLKKAGRLKKAGKFVIKHPKIFASLGGAGYAYFYHESSETYEEAKLKCQQTCQGFNNVNLSKLKYDQIVNLLYCRDSGNLANPCTSFDGGGTPQGNITLNPCPTGCTDIRSGQTSGQTEQDTHMNSMLFGSCEIKDHQFYCDYPQYKNQEEQTPQDRPHFGTLPLDKYKTDCGNPPCPVTGEPDDPEYELDKQFRDPWQAYVAMKGVGIIEGAAAGAAVGEMGSMLTNFPGSSILPAAGGVAGAVTSGALIPDDFPGHCLNKLFEHYTNDDPNNFISEGTSLTDGDESGNAVDYKYIRKCKSSDTDIDFGPNENGEVQKCDLITGEITTGSNNDEIGTCVAWKKTSASGGYGKCLPTMHSVSGLDAAADLVTLNVGQSAQDDANECLNIDNSDDCNNHQYCYWVKDGNDSDPNLENIYFCLNDKSLIDIHNGILDNDEDLYLIKETAASANVSGVLDETVDSIKKFNNYSGGEGDDKKEIDIGDICNNYCSNYLCHEPYISMPLIPGMENAGNYLKMIINFIIKFIFFFCLGFVLSLVVLSAKDGNNIISPDGNNIIPPEDKESKIIKLLKSIKYIFSSLVGGLVGGLVIGFIGAFIFTFTPVISESINEKLEPYSEMLYQYILKNPSLFSIFENDSFLGIFSKIL